MIIFNQETVCKLTDYFIAYFMNRLDQKGIHLKDRKITKNDYILSESEYHFGKQDFVEAKEFVAFDVIIHPEDVEDETNLVDFFRDKLIPVFDLSDCWNLFDILNDNKYYKIGFIELCTVEPYIFCFSHCQETGLIIRGMHAREFGGNEHIINFNMQFYIVKE